MSNIVVGVEVRESCSERGIAMIEGAIVLGLLLVVVVTLGVLGRAVLIRSEVRQIVRRTLLDRQPTVMTYAFGAPSGVVQDDERVREFMTNAVASMNHRLRSELAIDPKDFKIEAGYYEYFIDRATGSPRGFSGGRPSYLRRSGLLEGARGMETELPVPTVDDVPGGPSRYAVSLSIGSDPAEARYLDRSLFVAAKVAVRLSDPLSAFVYDSLGTKPLLQVSESAALRGELGGAR